MITIGVPPSSSLVDREFISIPGPDGTVKSYQYDAETKTLISKESQIIIPSFHGVTHITEDPIPEATIVSRGLMSKEDKAKLDALTSTRLGVLGFQGAGMPDDGGYMQGDIILAAGSEFISLERVGNIVRFTVDLPVPMNCGCEECAQLFWIQDESDTRSIRPPSCNGVMPGVNSYGELKIYAFPENSIFNPNKPTEFFNRKETVPTLQFRRYVNGNIPNTAEIHVVCRRRSDTTANVGWVMTPGPTEIPECTWYMGSDSEGRQIEFELLPESNPGLLGSLLYNGHTITRQTGVVSGYTANVLATNQYNVKKWDVQDGTPIGDAFIAVNLWEYTNISGSSSLPPILTLDNTVQLLPVGTIIELWQFEVSNVNNVRTFASYFSRRPQLNPAHLWCLTAAIRFGDLFEQRDDVPVNTATPTYPGTGTELTAHIDDVSDVRIYEKTQWGLTAGFEDGLLSATDGEQAPDGEYCPSGIILAGRQAMIDHSLPGLVITQVANPTGLGDLNHDGVVNELDLDILAGMLGKTSSESGYDIEADFNKDGVIDVKDLSTFGTYYNIAARKTMERPVFLWHRQNHKNFILKTKIGRPNGNDFPPIDILLGAPIDNTDDVYLQVVRRGVFGAGPYINKPYIVVRGVPWDKLPPNGTLRILTGVYREVIWKYDNKFFSGEDIYLSSAAEVFPFDDDYMAASDATVGGLNNVPGAVTLTELLHNDYTAPALRLGFSVNETTGSESVQLQLRVGTLSMSTAYENDQIVKDATSFTSDDFVRGFLPGEFAVSQTYTQIGFISDGIGQNVTSTPTDFKVYDGGILPVPISSETEKWNELIVMVRDGQVWVWWNNLLMTPDQTKSAALPVPVAVNTPYWPILPFPIGKVGFRLWPGAVLRDVEILDQQAHFNEFLLGQLSLQ